MQKSTSIKIDEMDEGTFNIQIGGNGYTVSKSKLKELMSSDGDIETLVRNIALRLSLDGTDINDFTTIKTNLEKILFKF